MVKASSGPDGSLHVSIPCSRKDQIELLGDAIRKNCPKVSMAVEYLEGSGPGVSMQ